MNVTIPKANLRRDNADYVLVIQQGEERADIDMFFQRFAAVAEFRVEISFSDDCLEERIAKLSEQRKAAKDDLQALEEQLKSYEAAVRKRGRPVDDK